MLVFDRNGFRSGVCVARGEPKKVKEKIVVEVMENGERVKKEQEVEKTVVPEFRFSPSDRGKQFDFGADEAFLLKAYPVLFKKA